MDPRIIKGAISKDERGAIRHNNGFDLSVIKRIYIIQNRDIDFVRGWKGHAIEKRWFAVMSGGFTIRLVKIDNWANPDPKAAQTVFQLSSEVLDVLYCPPGYATAIQATEEGSQLLTMSDYLLGDTNDEHTYPVNFFEQL